MPGTPEAASGSRSSPGVPALYLSISSDRRVAGLSAGNEDIIAWHGAAGFSLYFDGSDVGLSSFAIDAFAIQSPTQILMSFTAAGSIPGISGTVDDSDIVRFTAASLGDNTAGSFSLYFDASDVGLTLADEDVDAIELLPSGAFLLSTTGSFSVSGLSGSDKDIFACNSPTTGPSSACGSLTPYFVGTAVGLSNTNEDVDGLAVGGGNIYLSTTGGFSVSGLAGSDEDVFICRSPTTGTNTSCSSFSLFFDGSVYGLGRNDIKASDLP